MPEYELKFLDPNFVPPEEQEQRQRTLDELEAFIKAMQGRPLAVATLDELQSDQWDQTGGEVDYQDYYGQDIVNQVSEDQESETLVIANVWGLPVALAARDENGSWQGLGVDQRLREPVADILDRVLV